MKPVENMCIMTYSIEQLRSYSYLFSSQTCVRAMRFSDIEDARIVCHRFDPALSTKADISVWDYLYKIYGVLKRNYRNEYVYKNELLNAFLKNQLCTKDTVVINEFGVGGSIADVVMFNGLSKAFEIKSERDSDRRLHSQMSDYQQLFEECYIVVPEESYRKYIEVVEEKVGVLVLSHTSRGSISLSVERNAEKNEYVNVGILMQSVRTPEYKWMVQQINGSLPDVSCFKMFDACKSILMDVPDCQLHRLFNETVKRRNIQIGSLEKKFSFARQLFLSLGWSRNKEDELVRLYNRII